MTNSAIAADPSLWLRKQANRLVRLPTIALGFFFLSKSGYNLVDILYNNTSPNWNEFYSDLNAGIGLLGFASSMYLKDRDPKLLDKESLWKRVYKRLEKFVLYNPAPQPIPIPVPPRN